MIEVLVVIGVLVVLMGIIVISMRTLDRTTKARSTRATLSTLSALLKNAPDLPKFQLLPPNGPFAPVPTPGDVSATARNDPTVLPPISTLPAIQYTRVVMARLRAIPGNRTALDNFPSNQQWAVPRFPADASDTELIPLILDGWGNPILFVPAEGLSGVTFNGTPNRTIVSPNNRPFFASAGPDGNFLNGDDNINSFDVK
jgi:type II secretory pathway pseudopilin PulG